jgi:Stress responsive A/B Barrel Domain
MFVHAVYFWLREDLTAQERATFEELVHSLATIEDVHDAFIGRPAGTDRPVIDRSYSWAEILVFTDRAAHDRYQAHPTHTRFVERCGTFWTKVLIYDSETPGTPPGHGSER